MNNVIRRNVDVIVGGQYGSEGKGNIVSRIAGKYDCFVRTGGPNAGHKVKLGDRVFCFHHLPSGCVHNRKADLVLGAGAVIYPPVLLEEMAIANLEHSRLHIHPQAAVIDDGDRKLDSQLFRHIGTTGQGVGMATIRKIERQAMNIKLARNDERLLPFVSRYLEGPPGTFFSARHYNRILVEGTQGTLLSLHHGHWPYVTSRDTTVSGVLSEAGISPSRVNRVIMVVRTYPIRVKNPEGGTSGPMRGHELTWAEVARRSGQYTEVQLLDAELTSTTKRLRRVSEFSMDEFVWAYHLNGPTDIALTFTDYTSADQLWRITSSISGFAPVSLQSDGFGPEFVTWNNERDW